MSAAAAWMVGGLVLGALEMVAPGVFLLWVGLAAIGAGAATALLGLDWPAQIAAFVGLALVLVGFAAVRLGRRRPADVLNGPAAGLVGQTCRAIAFRDGEGRVMLGDGTWAARVSGETTPESGQALKIVGLEGTTLLVAANN